MVCECEGERHRQQVCSGKGRGCKAMVGREMQVHGEGMGGPWGQAAAVGTMTLHVPAAFTPATSMCVCVCVCVCVMCV